MKKKYMILIIIALMIILTLLYSRYISTSGLIVKEYKVESKVISDSYHGLKVVHLTDIHFGRTINEKEMKKIVERVNLSTPDIIVLTGDLFDRDTPIDKERLDELVKIFKKMKAKLGKFSVSGNHDVHHVYYEEIVTRSGFKNLDNNFELVYNNSTTPILIAGLSTKLGDETSLINKFDKLNLFLDESEENKNLYSILLMHEPDYMKDIPKNDFNLVLAGHSHNGQVRIPFIGSTILPPDAKKYNEPYYKLGETEFFISSGLGTSTMDFRFFNKPSINLYRLTRK